MSDSINFSRASDLSGQAANSAVRTGMAWFDMMLNLQRDLQMASLQPFLPYGQGRETRSVSRAPQPAADTQVIPVGEERLNVAARTVQGETTRIRRRVVSRPVEQEVVLREEKVVIERRPPSSRNSNPDVLTETVIEMSDSRQVPTVWKSLHVAEEVVLRRQVTERVEKVRETVRHDVVDVDHGREIEGHAERLPVRHEAETERQAQAHGEAHGAPSGKRPQIEAEGQKSEQDTNAPTPLPTPRNKA